MGEFGSSILRMLEEADLYQDLTTERSQRIFFLFGLNLVLIVTVLVVGIVLAVELGQSFKLHIPQRNDDDEFSQTIQIQNLMDHLERFEQIAASHSNSRSVNNGYNASVSYIQGKLTQTNFIVTTQPFSFTEVSFSDDCSFSQISPIAQTYIIGEDFEIIKYSPSGDITARIDIAGGDGCFANDFVGFTAGNIALINYGGNCTLETKAELAQAAGSAGVLFANSISQSTPLTGSFPETTTVTIPALGLGFLVADDLQSIVDPEVHIYVNSVSTTSYTMNLIAETPGGDANSIIVVGSHLDSVPAGPGINDNGSGSAVNLEVALQVFKTNLPVRNKIRFAWWGAEEEGLLGSSYYVNSLTEAERAQILVNLNYDMLASPNFMRGVYNGYEAQPPITTSSSRVASLYEQYFNARGLTYTLTEFNGRSDYGPFLEANITAGGLKTGSNGVKSQEERKEYGGFANAIYDPCYHQSCDTMANINKEIFIENGQAAAYVLEQLTAIPSLKSYLFD